MDTTMMDRIRDEMAREPAGSPIAAIGEYVTESIQAGHTIPKGKTLGGAYKAMEDWARKNRRGASCVCVPPSRAFAIVDEYFGFGEKKRRRLRRLKPQPLRTSWTWTRCWEGSDMDIAEVRAHAGALLEPGDRTPGWIEDRARLIIPHYIWTWQDGRKKHGWCTSCGRCTPCTHGTSASSRSALKNARCRLCWWKSGTH